MLRGLAAGTKQVWKLLAVILVLGAGVSVLISRPPIKGIEPGELGIRVNRLTGGVTVVREGGVLVVPKIHRLRRYALRDQVYRPTRSARATGESPFQSVEGLSLGVDLTVRYTLDADQIAKKAQSLPEDINRELVEPLVQGVVYRIFAQHTVREIFSTKRQEIQKAIEDELKPLLAADGVLLRAVFMGNVDLPPNYRAGLERLLTEELNTEQMRYTLELKDKQVKQSELEAEAEKIRREKAAEAAGNEQIIAAKAQAEAMKHVLPFKQKQIEQRQLEAEAAKVTRLKEAEASAQARRIESEGEADSRRKLAEAEAYKVEVIGKAASEQLARDGALIAQNPLLIQKTLADKLSDKISVIIAPPPPAGGFIASGLLGTGMPGPAQMDRPAYPAAGYVSPSESMGE
ncbi:MAG TPA: SPFH domain-containing protein [Candidatus Binatia bacterium]|jgi:regulator of protease activity HflC (stomatin/prohibitin superfamily)|nr:SPFH domain-containing protein [Candidatus Binatia bacterium]